MSTEQAGIPQHSAVAQQVHHAEQADERKPQPGPAPIAAATVLKPDLDVTPLRAIGKAIRCIVRPYRSDDAGRRMPRSRMAVLVSGAAAVISASIVVLRRTR